MYLIILIVTSFLLIAAGVLLPLYFLKWKPDSSKSLISAGTAAFTVFQVDFNSYFCTYFFSLRDRTLTTTGNDKYTRTDKNMMSIMKTDSTGCVFTFRENLNTPRVPTDLDLLTIDGVNTNRSLQELCGGTSTVLTFIPYFSTGWTGTMIATDQQINAKLASLAAEGENMETSPTQNNGAFYIATNSTGNYLSLNLGKIENGSLSPITNRNYAFNASQFPNTAFIFSDPTYNMTEIISTSAYNTNFGPYAMPTFNQSITAAGRVTIGASSPLYTSFILKVPALFVQNIQNELVSTTGEIVSLKVPQMPTAALTPYLKSGVSIMTLSTAQGIFGTNANIPLDISINSTTGVKDETQSYGMFCDNSSNLVYAVYNNTAATAKFVTYPTTAKAAAFVMLTGTSLTQSNVGDVLNLSILGTTYSAVPKKPVDIPSPPVLPLPNPPTTPEETQQQSFYEQTQHPKKSFYTKNKTVIYVVIGVFTAISLSAMIYLMIRFYWKKPMLDNATPATPTETTTATTTPTQTPTVTTTQTVTTP